MGGFLGKALRQKVFLAVAGILLLCTGAAGQQVVSGPPSSSGADALDGTPESSDLELTLSRDALADVSPDLDRGVQLADISSSADLSPDLLPLNFEVLRRRAARQGEQPAEPHTPSDTSPQDSGRTDTAGEGSTVEDRYRDSVDDDDGAPDRDNETRYSEGARLFGGVPSITEQTFSSPMGSVSADHGVGTIETVQSPAETAVSESGGDVLSEDENGAEPQEGGGQSGAQPPVTPSPGTEPTQSADILPEPVSVSGDSGGSSVIPASPTVNDGETETEDDSESNDVGVGGTEVIEEPERDPVPSLLGPAGDLPGGVTVPVLHSPLGADALASVAAVEVPLDNTWDQVTAAATRVTAAAILQEESALATGDGSFRGERCRIYASLSLPLEEEQLPSADLPVAAVVVDLFPLSRDLTPLSPDSADTLFREADLAVGRTDQSLTSLFKTAQKAGIPYEKLFTTVLPGDGSLQIRAALALVDGAAPEGTDPVTATDQGYFIVFDGERDGKASASLLLREAHPDEAGGCAVGTALWPLPLLLLPLLLIVKR
ncbi:MAG: hypothetical protein K9L28_06740 [Synergistales bacterium]|nr:hypothetical protein [Synergistales bacterium]